jgi:hypothetical protein
MKWLFVLLAACGSAQTTQAPNNREQPRLDTIPAEVTTVVDRWTNCWHFAGEEAYDDARRIEIEAGINQWCPGNEAERARLEAKYRDRPDVMSELAKLDEMQ